MTLGLHSASLGLVFRAGQLHPRLSVIIPLDSDVNEDIKFIVTAGVQGVL